MADPDVCPARSDSWYFGIVLILILTDGKHEEAIDILAQLKGKGIQPSDPAVVKQKKSIDNALALEEADGP